MVASTVVCFLSSKVKVYPIFIQFLSLFWWVVCNIVSTLWNLVGVVLVRGGGGVCFYGCTVLGIVCRDYLVWETNTLGVGFRYLDYLDYLDYLVCVDKPTRVCQR